MKTKTSERTRLEITRRAIRETSIILRDNVHGHVDAQCFAGPFAGRLIEAISRSLADFALKESRRAVRKFAKEAAKVIPATAQGLSIHDLITRLARKT